MATRKPNLNWFEKVGSKKLSVFLILLLLVAIAALLRYHNISPYLIYPDSYQNLIVAENIRHGYGLVGRLGELGMWYPDTLWWTRPAYALLISLFSSGAGDMVGVAKTIAFVAGILLVPTVYVMLQKLWSNRAISLLGAGLVTISYAGTVWGGFVQTESLGILMMAAVLAVLFETTRKQNDGVTQFLALGSLFGLAVLTRYEYIVLTLPITYWLYQHRGNEWKLQFGAAGAGVFFVIALALFALGPVPFTFEDVRASVQSFALPLVAVIFVLGAGIYTVQKVARIKKGLLASLPYILPLSAAAMLLVGGIGSFVSSDFLVCALGLYGMVRLLQDHTYRAIGIFALLSITLLSAVYYEVNPDMQRYWTHTLPFLVLVAAYGGYSLAEKVIRSESSSYRVALSSLAILALLLQTGLAWQGLHQFKDGLWFRPGYEEVAAQKVKEILPADVIIIAPTPEPYHLFTGRSVHSVALAAPYLYLPEKLDGKNVAVIDDESMRYYFPKFSTFAESSLQRYKTHQFFVGEPFRERNNVLTEKKPVTVYVLPLKNLKDAIDSASRP